LFVVLTAVWVVYCLVVYTMQRQARAEKVAKSEFRDCYELKGQPFSECSIFHITPADLECAEKNVGGACRWAFIL
jgi:hypothetical protein